MQRKFIKVILILLFLSFPNIKVFAQNSDFNIRVLDNPSSGYIYTDWQGIGFVLVDNYGNIKYLDSSNSFKDCVNWKMRRDGAWGCFKISSLMIYNENIELIREIRFPNQYVGDIHNCEVLDNGHYLLFCRTQRTFDLSQIVDGGQEDAIVNACVIVETDQNGTVYFEWYSFDYFNITDATEYIDLTNKTINFQHPNSIAIDLDGNFLLSSRHLDEITKIDNLTGYIIWRLGGSGCKNNQFIFVNDTVDGFFGFSHQHSADVLPDGNILLFDNGNLKPTKYSRAVEYSLNLQNITATKVWEYRYSPDIYRESMANAQRLENGNTLINWVAEKITEVRSDNNISFELILPEGFVEYRAFRYLPKMNAKRVNINSSGILISAV